MDEKTTVKLIAEIAGRIFATELAAFYACSDWGEFSFDDEIYHAVDMAEGIVASAYAAVKVKRERLPAWPKGSENEPSNMGSTSK